MSNIDDLTTVKDMPVAPDQCDPADKQRLRIHVPNISTTLSMGALAQGGMCRAEDGGTEAYDGFNVDTAGNIFMVATKSVTIQAIKHIDIHTQNCAYLSAVKDVGLSSQTGNTFMQGGGGVLISGGVAWSGHDQIKALGEPDIETPNWLNSCVNTTTSVNNLWSWVDGIAAGLNISIAAVRTALDIKQPLSSHAWTAVQAIIDGLNIAGNAGWADFGAGTTIHGQSGLILGTFGTMGIYSGLGTGMMSCISVSSLAPSVGMIGVLDASVESAGTTTVMGRKELMLYSGGTVTLSSRGSDVQMLGTALFLGGPAAEDGASQRLTNKVETNSDSVVVNTDDFVTKVEKTYELDADDLLLGAGNAMNLQATKDLTVQSKNVEITADGGKLSLMVSGGMGLHLKKSELFIGINTAEPPFDAGAAGKGRSTKKKKKAKEAALKAWKKKVTDMKAGDVGIKFKKTKIQLIVKQNKLIMDGSKFKTGSLVWKK